MARPEITGRKTHEVENPRAVIGNNQPPPLAYSIERFCVAVGISEGMFYKLKKAGLGPRTMKVGARTLITIEAAAAWCREREAAE